MASYKTETVFQGATAGLVTAHVSRERPTSWVSINSYVHAGANYTAGAPMMTVFMPGTWQQQRAELQRIIDECETARAALLAGFEASTDKAANHIAEGQASILAPAPISELVRYGAPPLRLVRDDGHNNPDPFTAVTAEDLSAWADEGRYARRLHDGSILLSEEGWAEVRSRVDAKLLGIASDPDPRD